MATRVFLLLLLATTMIVALQCSSSVVQASELVWKEGSSPEDTTTDKNFKVGDIVNLKIRPHYLEREAKHSFMIVYSPYSDVKQSSYEFFLLDEEEFFHKVHKRHPEGQDNWEIPIQVKITGIRKETEDGQPLSEHRGGGFLKKKYDCEIISKDSDEAEGSQEQNPDEL